MIRPTTTIQSAEPKIVALAKNWAGGETRPEALAANLCRGVFKYLKKSLAANSEDALTILERREGDCTEHTLLFVAVARACGLPAREVGGLALGQSQGKPVLAWHAWPEFHDGSCWRAVDPTWNEPGGVDGTHWKLSVGDRDSAWLNLMGRLKVRVERVETR
jgi:transglutaminase-like putative cysteine protease